MGPSICLLLGAACLAVDGDRAGLNSCYLYQPAFSIDYELRGPAQEYVSQPGDIFVCTGHEMWAKFGHLAATAQAPQHSGIVFARRDGRMALLEAGPHNTFFCRCTDVCSQLPTYADHERVWIRRRRVPLSAEQSAALTAFAEATEGKRYAVGRMFAQITPLKSRGPLRTEYMGGPHGQRSSYFCSELVAEACVAAGLLDCETTRPAAMYPRDLFFGHSRNPYIDKHLDMSEWDAPARCTLGPGLEPQNIRRFPRIDGDTR